MVAKARTKANVRPLTNSGMKARHRLCKTLWHHFWLKSYQLQPTSMTLVWKFFVYWELCMLSTVIGDPYLKVCLNLVFKKCFLSKLWQEKTCQNHICLKSYWLESTSLTRVWKLFVYGELCMLSTVIECKFFSTSVFISYVWKCFDVTWLVLNECFIWRLCNTGLSEYN